MPKRKTFANTVASVAFKDAAQVLNNSPLFKMSLGAKELFHSDFMKWLGEKHPHILSYVLRKFLKQDDLEILGLYREKNQIDLQVKARINGKISRVVIENKVKSIPNKSQLKRYGEKEFGEKARYILLTTSKPTFETDWKVLLYGQYLDLLRKADRCLGEDSLDSYEEALLDDYIQFTQAVMDIVTYYDESAKYLYDPDEIVVLQSLRIKDLIGKMVVSKMAREVSKQIENRYGIQPFFSIGGSLWTEQEEGPFEVEVNYLKGTPICSVFYHFDKDYYVGVQMDELELRICFREPKVDEKDAGELLAGKLKNWFDGESEITFSCVPKPTNGTKRINVHGFGEYKDNNHLWQYRRYKLDEHERRTKNVLRLMMGEVERMYGLQDEIHSQIITHRNRN